MSIATASYVLSGRVRRADGRRRYSTATENRVLEVAAELNYVPNLAARTVRTGRTGLIQLSLSMLSDPWSLAMVEAVNSEAQKKGLLATILADGDWAQMLRLQQSDATFIDNVLGVDRPEQELKTLVRQGRILVVMNETLQPEGFDVIRSMAIPGCRLMVDYLARTYDTIGCIASAKMPPRTDETRLTPYLEMMEATGRPVRSEWLRFYENIVDSAYAQALAILSLPDRPRALYTTTDFAAQAAVAAAQKLGLRVPEDVAISGVGNTPGGETSDPSLTTVGPTGFFESVARIIVDRAEGTGGEPQIHDFPWKLHLRESA